MKFLSNLTKEQLSSIVKVFDIQIAIVLVLTFYLTKSIFSKFIITILNKFRKKKEKAKDSKMFKPIEEIYVFIGIYLAVNILPVGVELSLIMNTLLKLAIVLFITRFITSIVLAKDSELIKKIFKKGENESASEFICIILTGLTWFIAIFIMFLIVGIDLSGLITGLGLGAAVISLAAQDTVKSLFSGFSILSDKPFVIGDWISVGNFAGTVTNITFRSTRIKCADNSIVTIPNSTITSEYVINWNKLTSRRFECTLNLCLNETSEKIKKITREMKMVLSNKEYIDESTIHVVLDKISAYSSEIKIFLYVKETDYYKYIRLKEDIYCSLLNILEKENIELAYPTETVHVRTVKENNSNEV